MAKVECEVEEIEIENDKGRMQEGVQVTCGNCGYVVQSFGTSGRSVRRCLVLLKEECPEGEKNFYEADYDED